MFQLAFVAVLFKFKYRGPSLVPLLQLPNRRATAPERRRPAPLSMVTIFRNKDHWGNCPLRGHPQTP